MSNPIPGADPDPTSRVIARLSQCLASQPFHPFAIVMSNGSRHLVPSVDHCTFTRISRQINVDHDDGSFVWVNPLHVAEIELLDATAA